VNNVTDPNPGELNGRKTLILGGNGGKSTQAAEAFFSEVRIRIP
jgi:hypothetical protein